MNAADEFVYRQDRTMDVRDGKFHRRDGTIHAPDRTMNATDEFVYRRDGTMDVRDGNFHRRHGTIHAPDRTINQPYGTMEARLYGARCASCQIVYLPIWEDIRKPFNHLLGFTTKTLNMSERPRIDRLGNSKVEHFFSQHGWLYREQTLHDYGIDAQVEIVKDDKPTGDLIAIQIKSGSSYFSEIKNESIVFRTDDSHIDYWFRHCLPVIIIIYNPCDDICYWQNIADDTILRTGKGWKIEIPINKKLTKLSLDELCQITQPPPYIKKLNKLRLEKQWMQLVSDEETVYIEFESWINKTLPRFEIKIGCDSKDNIETEVWPTSYGEMEEVIAYLLPWANYEMDLEAYEEAMRDEWHDECYIASDEDGQPLYYQEFDEWLTYPEDITPISSNGETEQYRLILSLNEIGKAFLELDEYLFEQ
jgi:hypothetical protein